MLPLRQGARSIGTVFDLVGHQENDFTAALGWTFARCPELLRLVLSEVGAEFTQGLEPTVGLQQHQPELGLTDIEIDMGATVVIIEAKLGWDLPGAEQLAKYSQRAGKYQSGLLLVVSECAAEYAMAKGLPTEVGGLPVRFLRWHRFADLAEDAASSGSWDERWAAKEFSRYLRSEMTAQDPRSNIVRVVALDPRPVDWMTISLADVVLVKGLYFNPVAKRGFPREPPNYFGFRLDGKLESVRHVDSWEYCTDPHSKIPEVQSEVDWSEEPHFIYTLGPPIRPDHDVRTGSGLPFGRHCEVAIDLLLTASTITEARDATRARDGGQD